jgi:hypothetical protein
MIAGQHGRNVGCRHFHHILRSGVNTFDRRLYGSGQLPVPLPAEA